MTQQVQRDERPTCLGPLAAWTCGARITKRPSDGKTPPGTDVLFLIDSDGRLTPATASGPPIPRPGDTLVLLGPGMGENPPGG